MSCKKSKTAVTPLICFSQLLVSAAIFKWNIDERCHLLIIIYVWIKLSDVQKVNNNDNNNN